MVKLVLGLGAAFLYGSLGAAIGFAAPQADERPAALMAPDLHVDDTNRAVQAAATGHARRPITPGEMSDEEKERRRQICEKEYEFCYDWCSRSRRTKYEQRMCYEDCSEKNADCMKKIS